MPLPLATTRPYKLLGCRWSSHGVPTATAKMWSSRTTPRAERTYAAANTAFLTMWNFESREATESNGVRADRRTRCVAGPTNLSLGPGTAKRYVIGKCWFGNRIWYAHD
jgi:hypothetical protein